MGEIDKLLEVMARLRDPEKGCTWDLEQNFRTIAPYTVEEAYEVADAIERGDMGGLRDELGDLLLQVVFHAQMAAEQDLFDFDAVAAGICAKLVRRHPHVFGSAEEIAAGPQQGSWEAIKASERSGGADGSALAGVARALPALKRAQKLGERAASVGFDWKNRAGVREKIREELEELGAAVGKRDTTQIEEEFGDLLFSIVNLARHLDVDPEHALSVAIAKFDRRFRDMEAALAADGRQLKDLSAADAEHAWRAAKRRLANDAAT